MRPQRTFARRARVTFVVRLTLRVAFALVFAAAIASAFLLAHTAAARADDDVERSVALMAKIGFASYPSFSPDGSRVAFVTNVSGSPQVWTILASGGYPTLVTAFDDPVGFVTWSPGGEWLAFSVAPGGGFNEQIYVARPDGTELRRLTEGDRKSTRLNSSH